MSSFLDICKSVDVLLGSQGVFTSVVTTNGFQQGIVKYVQKAWNNIQVTRKDWKFLRRTVAFSTVLNQESYSLEDIFGVGVANPVGEWVVDRFIKDDFTTLEYIPYETWILQDHSRARDPRKFTINSNAETTAFLVMDKPDGVYNYTLHYNRKPQLLEENTDVPICPTEFHDLIIYQALADLSANLGNSDIYSTSAITANQLYNTLLRSQCPAKRISKARPLA